MLVPIVSAQLHTIVLKKIQEISTIEIVDLQGFNKIPRVNVCYRNVTQICDSHRV